MNWTCCNCYNTFTENSGDVDERMCYSCLAYESETKPLYTLVHFLDGQIKLLQSDPVIRLNHKSPKCCEV